jgi:hypothetical protein
MQNKENQPFSKRFGHFGKNQEITVREDAPENFRYAVIAIACKEVQLSSSILRDIVCQVLRIRPDKEHNWGEPNISNEVQYLMDSCEWYRIYDIIEAIYSFLERCRRGAISDYEESINECLVEMGIGWKLVNGAIETRGEEAFELVVKDASEALDDAGLTISKQELNEAIRALSRRPEPNLSGAVFHAMAALECVAREVTGGKETLGSIIKKYPDLLPKPLDEAISKVWGYSSEIARHGKEERTLEREEVQLVVGLAATVATYLTQKLA